MWSYSGDPAASQRDEVRFLLGDTNKEDKQLSDEEIAYLISKNPKSLAAAATGAEVLGARYARQMDKSIGPIRVSYSQRVQQYNDLAEKLWVMAGGKNYDVDPLPMWVGGLSESEKTRDLLDTDLVQPAFRRDMFHPTDQPIENVNANTEEES